MIPSRCAAWSLLLTICLVGCGGGSGEEAVIQELQRLGKETAAAIAKADSPATVLATMDKYWPAQRETVKKLKDIPKERISKIIDKLKRALTEGQEQVDSAIWAYQEKLSAAKPNPVVVMETSLGSVKMELFEDLAPVTVKNFLQYTDDKFFDGTIFHRVMADFMIQGGGFLPGMKEKDTRASIKNEATNGLANKRGTMAMARTNIPDSATAQFFINVVDNPPLNKAFAGDGFGYAVFGRVIEGMDVVDKIRKVDTGTSGGHENVPKENVLIKSIRRGEKK